MYARITLLATGLALFPAMVSAQQPSAKTDPGIAALDAQWRQVTRFITRAAEQLSPEDYAYRPVATVRTFGQLIGHVAGAQFAMCAAALGDKPRGEDDIEKSVTTKGDLVAALKQSTEYCNKAYAQSAASAATITDLYGDKVPRMNALALNAVHNGEHYGNIITYMRMKGLVPPSSQP